MLRSALGVDYNESVDVMKVCISVLYPCSRLSCSNSSPQQFAHCILSRLTIR